MAPDALLSLMDQIGIFVFALSGAVMAVRKAMDIFGIVFLACLPAIGGGTIRDVLLDQPIFWFSDTTSLLLILAAAICVFFFHARIENFRPLRWADAVGMSLFAVTGAAKALSLGLHPAVVVIMGVITACAGGLLRDIVANEEPLLLKTDIYATAAMVGAGVYVGANSLGISANPAFLIAMGCAFCLRSATLIFNLSLPKSPWSSHL